MNLTKDCASYHLARCTGNQHEQDDVDAGTCDRLTLLALLETVKAPSDLLLKVRSGIDVSFGPTARRILEVFA